MPGGASVPRDMYIQMDWWVVDKLAVWMIFRKKMEIILVADSTPMDIRYAIVLVAGGDEAFNH